MANMAPLKMNIDFLIPNGMKGQGPIGSLDLLKGSFPEGEFQALLNENQSVDKNNKLVGGIIDSTTDKQAEKILKENGLLLSKSEKSVVKEGLIDKKIQPLKLGISSGNNQKVDQKINEFLKQADSRNIGVVKNTYMPKVKSQDDLVPLDKKNKFDSNILKFIQNNKNSGMQAKVNAQVVPNSWNTARLSDYQKLSTKDKAQIIRMKFGNRKDSKKLSDVVDTSNKKNSLLEFTLNQNMDNEVTSINPSSGNKNILGQSGAQVSSKVINLDQVNMNDPQALIDKITDYIVEKTFASKDSIDLTVRHSELGKFRINVSKMHNVDNINLEIITTNNKGHEFFLEHENNLARSLANSGIKLVDVKITTAQESFMSSQDNNSSSKEFFSFNKGSEHSLNDNRDGENSDSQRRRRLWEMYKERKEA